MLKLEGWDDLKPVRGLIEDFFKVGKDLFGLGKFHKYSTKSMTKTIYLCLMLTAICVQQGYMSKTKMQQLSEGNIELRPPIQHRKKKKSETDEKQEVENVPQTNQITTLPVKETERQTSHSEYC